jgi:hypothetical protein
MVSRVSSPELSLAVALYGGANAQGYVDWLGSIDKATLARIELIFASNAPVSIQVQPNATVRVIVGSGQTPMRLLGVAVAAARAPHVGLLDGHAVPSAGWADAMLEALQGGGDRFWGPVVCEYAWDDRRIIGYLTEYAQFHAPVPAGLREVPGNNLVIRHPGCAARGELRSKGLSKTALIEAWAEQPDDWPVRVDRAFVTHRRTMNRRAYIVRRYRHGRSYGGVRARHKTPAMRFAIATRLGMLPFLRVARIGLHVRRSRLLSVAFLRHLPAIVLAETGWSIGELVGTLCGTGKAPELLD